MEFNTIDVFNEITNNYGSSHCYCSFELKDKLEEVLVKYDLTLVRAGFEKVLNIITSVDWSRWFEMAEFEEFERGGMLLFHKKTGKYVNPIFNIGNKEGVTASAGEYVSIHTHPGWKDRDFDALKPSEVDWLCARGRGAQIVVIKWGLFIHEYIGDLDGIKYAVHILNPDKFPTDGSHNTCKLFYIPRESLCIEKYEILLNTFLSPSKTNEEVLRYCISDNLPTLKFSTPELSTFINNISVKLEINEESVKSKLNNMVNTYENMMTDAINSFLGSIIENYEPIVDTYVISANINLSSDKNNKVYLKSIEFVTDEEVQLRRLVCFDNLQLVKYVITEQEEVLDDKFIMLCIRSKISNYDAFSQFTRRFNINYT